MQHQFTISFDYTVDSDENINDIIECPEYILISDKHKIINYTIEAIEYMGSREKDDQPFTMKDW